MDQDPKKIRRPTKRPMASKNVHIDQECSNCLGCSFSNLNSSQSISPEHYTLSTLKEEISKFDNGCIDKAHAVQSLQYHLAILERYRNEVSNLMIQVEHARLSSRPEQVSKAQVVNYNIPLKIRSGFHHPSTESSSSRNSVIIPSNFLHGSTSSANLLSMTRSSTPLSPSASSSSISFPIQRSPSSPASSRDKLRSASSEPNSLLPQVSDALMDKSSTLINNQNTLENKNDDDVTFLGSQDSFFRAHSDPLNTLSSVSFSSSSATLPISNIASIPRSMSASHFSRNSNSVDGQGDKDSSSGNAPNSTSTKSMTALTIWNNVNKFFVVTPTVEQFQPRLQLSEVPDPKLPLGPHYSIGINQKLKQKFKNGNVQLRIPPEVIAESPEGVTSIIFHRLLAAFVTLSASEVNSLKRKNSQNRVNPDDNTSREDNRDLSSDLTSRSSSDISNLIEDNSNENSNISVFQPKVIDTSSLSCPKPDSKNYQNLNYFDDYCNVEQYPVNVAGTSIYSMCPFEQKLMLEVQSLNLIPEPSGLKMTDNEVMNDIIDKTKELKQVTDETNKMKTCLLETLKKEEKGLLERKEKSKKWGTVSFRVEQGPKKDLKRPKKRDKLI